MGRGKGGEREIDESVRLTRGKNADFVRQAFCLLHYNGPTEHCRVVNCVTSVDHSFQLRGLSLDSILVAG